jgi:hypothetical protein
MSVDRVMHTNQHIARRGDSVADTVVIDRVRGA